MNDNLVLKEAGWGETALQKLAILLNLIPGVGGAVGTAAGSAASGMMEDRFKESIENIAGQQDSLKQEILEKLDKLAELLSQKENISKDVIFALLLTVDPNIKPGDKDALLAILADKLRQLKELQTTTKNLQSEDSEVKRLEQAAEKALAEGRFDDAENSFLQAKERKNVFAASLKEAQHEELQSAAESSALAARTAALQLNPQSYRRAAEHYAEAANIIASVDASIALEYRERQANMLCQLGDKFNDNDVLHAAIGDYRTILSVTDRVAHSEPRARIQNNLCTALSILGERENRTELLEEAVVILCAVLEEHTRGRTPLDWARTQNNRGVTLQALGKLENGTTRLEEAVTAYLAALEERTRERVPLSWASTQNNLGTALSILGERKNETKLLEEAVVALRTALEERTRERVPLDWAATQSNLGNALLALGKHESGTQHLEEAVTAYRAALEVLSLPLERHRAQVKLEEALSLLKQRRS